MEKKDLFPKTSAPTDPRKAINLNEMNINQLRAEAERRGLSSKGGRLLLLGIIRRHQSKMAEGVRTLNELVKELEEKFEQTKVILKERKIYDDTGISTEIVYDIYIISPIFQDHDYEERINMIWPLFFKLPDEVFKIIRSLDCQTPAEYHRKVA